MFSRLYHAPVIFAFLCAALLAGCTEGASVPSAPVNAVPANKPHRDVSGVRIWAAPRPSPPNSPSIVFGLSAGGKKILALIKTAKQSVPGYYPSALRVDHDQNLWVLNQSATKSVSGPQNAVIQEYTNGNFTAAYVPSCPTYPGSLNCNPSEFSSHVTDVAVGSGYVFALGTFTFEAGSAFEVASGWEYWPIGNPSATPGFNFLGLPNECKYSYAVCQIYSGDLDAAGDLWLMGAGCSDSQCTQRLGLVEVTTPWAPPANQNLTELEGFGTYANPGFVYVSGNSTSLNNETVNVEVPANGSQYSADIYQYHAATFTFNESPYNILTPCIYGCVGGDFGFNKSSKQIVVGDGSSTAGWIDIGVAAKNTWKQVTNPQITVPLGSAAYTPSDK